ncbi:hypothetical protein A2U01_0052863 [Trifolium medium]|uniref:Uncharacterized protein n=1 Tax=Trifolium medium TaxID=97028 RepID=A0A392R4Y3_9FABA|nr:hypothetical protein [Trifolium medium]
MFNSERFVKWDSVTTPSKEFTPNLNISKFVSDVMLVGISPNNLLSESHKILKDDNIAMSLNVPEMQFSSNNSACNEDTFPLHLE